MTHYRTTIRRGAKALLKADAYFAEATNVISSAKVDVDSVPCWSVSTPNEDRMVLNATSFEARTNLVVALSVTASASTLEDLLDQKSEDIERLILAGLTEESGPQNVQLKRTEIKTGPEDKNIIGSVLMLFEVTGYIHDI